MVSVNGVLYSGRPNRPHYRSCPSACPPVCLSICPIRAHDSKRKERRKTKICLNVPQGWSNWCASFQLFFFVFFGARSNFNKLKTPDQWLWTCRQCLAHNKMSKCRTVVVLIKIETDVSGSSWKSRNSLSPELV